MFNKTQRKFIEGNKETLLMLYQFMAVPPLLNWTENWPAVKEHERRSERRWIFRSVARYTSRDHKTDEGMRL